MKSNIWNLKAGKERLEILERTQAQKRHLMGLINAKSQINTHHSSSPRYPSSPISLLRKKIIADDNKTLARKIASLSRASPDRLNTSLTLSRSLKTYSSMNRTIRQKAIDL